MPCYADTIVRIKYVCKTEKVDASLMVVWAIGLYPINREQNKIELVLFVPVNFDERDSETQAVFEKDSFYSVGGKIVPNFYRSNDSSILTGISIFNKVAKLNKCPLKVSLVGSSQESPRLLANDDAIFDMLINDYASQEYNFIIKLKIIDNTFYVYVKDINFINTQLSFKQKMFDNSNSSKAINIIQSKLLSTHQNVIEDLKGSSEAKAISFTLTNKSDKESEFNLYSSRSIFSSNRKKSKYSGKSADVLDSIIDDDFDQDETVDMNILDQDDKSEEIQKKKMSKEHYEVIDTNEINQNNESEEI
ncbi:4489_t:CDS:2 [Scutellospora calospora]|uniref:4489_t:CDS:1 n=1 Tax=Scutellospora calospora TaxID=85575 RepID=A0ACA9L129_9GLOM|nr:4489_t:CDS:2 [Scutellospora calospora]